jgi:hypothetical protein
MMAKHFLLGSKGLGVKKNGCREREMAGGRE